MVGKRQDVGILATYGRHIRVSSMLARDSIQSRLELGGIGFNEFTYQIYKLMILAFVQG